MVDISKIHQVFIKLLTIIIYFILFYVLAALLPQYAKELSPYYWGRLEGKLGYDMTGFLFTPLYGAGNCRIVNAREAFLHSNSKIVLGMVQPQNGKQYAHLWALVNDSKIDLTCPESKLDCKDRRVFAILDSRSLSIEYKNTINKMDDYHISWGKRYLSGLKMSVYTQ